MSNEYLKQAEKFLSSCDASLTIEYLDHRPYFPGESVCRDVYTFTLLTPMGSYTATYGNSINHSQRGIEPNAYDVLACLDGYPPGESFNTWCDETGYDNNSISALKTYSAVVDEYNGLEKIFSSEQLEQLGDIQ